MLFAVACTPADLLVELPPPPPPPPPAQRRPPPPPVTDLAGVEEAALDRSVSPCEDFYGYACGGWHKALGGKTRAPRLEKLLEDRTADLVATTLEAFDQQSTLPAQQRLGAWFVQCKQLATRGGAQLGPLYGQLGIKARVKTGDGDALAGALARLHVGGVLVGFSLDVAADPRDPAKAILEIAPGDLPAVTSDEEEGHTLHEAERLLAASGVPDETAQEDARALLKVARAAGQAEVSAAVVLPQKKLAELSPVLAWKRYLEARGLDGDVAVLVRDPARVQAELGALARLDEREFLAVLQVRALRRYAVALGPKLRAAHLDEERASGARICADLAIELQGEALGAALGRALESGGAVEAATPLTQILLNSAGDEIGRWPWLDDVSRDAARKALAPWSVRLGAPARAADAPPLAPSRGARDGSLAAVMRGAFGARDRALSAMAKRGKAPDPTPGVFGSGLLSDPARGEILIPTTMLHVPFAGAEVPLPAMYGGLGTLLSRELLAGALPDLRSPTTRGREASVVACLDGDAAGWAKDAAVRQPSGATALLDILALRMAFRAMEAELSRPGQESLRSAQLAERRFFLAWAQSACGAARTDGDARARVDFAVSRTPEVAQAYGCEARARSACGM